MRLRPAAGRDKLKPDWEGPFIVTQQVSDHTVLMVDTHGKAYKCHVDRLKPWKPSPAIPDSPVVRRSARLQAKSAQTRGACDVTGASLSTTCAVLL